MKPYLNLIDLSGQPISRQLLIEEALLRADQKNWCLLNHNTPDAIVMGISGKPEKLLNIDLLKKNSIPLIRRFSGGGTVVIDSNTYFITFIFNQADLPVPAFPQPIMKWTEDFYRPIFAPLPFALRENDYVLETKKFGGNAQYIQKSRWLHHTSFLWDYDKKKMEYLLLPEKRPLYRENRSHEDFLCKLKDYFPDKQSFLNQLKTQLHAQFFVENASNECIDDILLRPHRSSTEHISY